MCESFLNLLVFTKFTKSWEHSPRPFEEQTFVRQTDDEDTFKVQTNDGTFLIELRTGCYRIHFCGLRSNFDFAVLPTHLFQRYRRYRWQVLTWEQNNKPLECSLFYALGIDRKGRVFIED